MDDAGELAGVKELAGWIHITGREEG